MAKELGPLSGFRDMLAEQMLPRQQMIDTIRKVYEIYGFVPLGTPALERHEILTGKYGEEGEKLMYQFVDNGGRKVAMRYDLTVPLARVVGNNLAKLPMPYKRYQVGDVWRGESPQAGRFREFMQFDADIVGTKSPIADAEVVSMMVDSMKALNVDALVRVNNRRILDALVEKAGITDADTGRYLVSAIDKVEKLGVDEIIEQIKNNLGETPAILTKEFLSVTGSSSERLLAIKELLGESDAANEGIQNLVEVFEFLAGSGLTEDQVTFDQTIARGLNYYTGIIYETTLKKLPKIGSVCSGGRYDNLVKDLGGPDLPAVGASIGVDRLFAALQQLGMAESISTKSQVIIANFDPSNVALYMKLSRDLRNLGIASEVYYDNDKLGKQFKHAEKLGIPYMIIIGSNELEQGIASVRDLKTREKTDVPLDKLATFFAEKINKNNE